MSEGIGREEEIYTSRFSTDQDKAREDTWDVLVTDYFQKLITQDQVVCDLGAGDGLFITKIKCKKRYAVDLSPHVKKLEEKGITVLLVPGTNFSSALPELVDVIFMSNFLEHMPDKSTLLKVLDDCLRALKPGGRVIILQPNIRYVGPAYWDYIDHHVALTEHSLREALEISGFTITKMVPQFLPYTAKSTIGVISSMLPTKSLVRAYLNMPFVWKFFGAQTLVIATKSKESKIS